MIAASAIVESLFRPLLDEMRATMAGSARLNMAPLLLELAEGLPADVQLDGDLVAFNGGGEPDFHLLGDRTLHRHHGVPVTYMVFDVPAFEGEPTTGERTARSSRSGVNANCLEAQARDRLAPSGRDRRNPGAGQRTPRPAGGLSPRKTPRRLELTAWRRARRGDRTAAVMPGASLPRSSPTSPAATDEVPRGHGFLPRFAAAAL
jgi:hypothetical protein